MGVFSGTGLTPSLKGVVTNVVALQAGQVQIISPAGNYAIRCGLYTTIQQYDPITKIWRNCGGGVVAGGTEFFYSDGVNYRLANQTGCVVGAVITNVGSGYTSAPTITTSLLGTYTAIVGGAVSQTVTIVNGGSNYTYPPLVQIAAPPAGGVQATGYCTLTTGAVSSVTIIDQGAGYNAAPVITFANDPREGLNGTTVGYAAAAQTVLTGAKTITAITCQDHGSPVAVTAGSATSIPTFTIAGGGGSSLAVTAVMNWAITGLVTAGYQAGAVTSGTPVAWLTGEDVQTAANSTVLNPTIQNGLVRMRKADIKALITAGAYPAAYNTAGGFIINDGGIYTGTPLAVFAQSPAATVTTGPLTAFAMGGQNDVSYLTQI